MDIQAISQEIEKISSAYAEKFGIYRDSDWYILKLQEEIGELVQSYLMMIGQARSKEKTARELRESFENEIADVLCHILLLAKHHNVDIEKNISQKWLKYSQGQY